MSTRGIQRELVRGDKTMAKNKWMQNVSEEIDKSGHKGIFSAAAKRAGMSTREYAEKNKNAKGTLGKRARLALVFENTSKK